MNLSSMFTRYDRYGCVLNTHDLLKFIAITFMIIDHTGFELYQPDNLLLRALGRVSFPVFLFLVGYSKNYRFRSDLLAYACMLCLFDYVANHWLFPLNILFSIILTRIVLEILENWISIEKHLILIAVLSVLLWIPTNLVLDYGSSCLLFAVGGYLVRKKYNKTSTLIFLTFSFAFHGLTQKQFLLGDDPFLITILISISAALCWSFYRYELKELSFSLNRFILIPVLFTARNSMQIYFLHFALFKLIAWYMYPEIFDEFTLIPRNHFSDHQIQ